MTATPPESPDVKKPGRTASLGSAAHLAHFVQHLYIGAGPLILPLVMKDMALTYTLLGVAISARTLCAGLFQLLYGYLCGWFGKKAILNASNLLSGASSIGMGVSTAFAPFLCFNALWGLATSPVHPLAGALRAEQSQGRGPRFDIGMFYSYAYVGNLVGAIMVLALLSHIGWQGVFVAMGLVTLLALGHGLLLRADAPDRERTSRTFAQNLKTALRDRRVVLVCGVGILLFGGTNVFIRHLLPLYLTSDLGVPITDASLIYIGISVAGIVSPTLFGRLSRSLGQRPILISLALALAFGFVHLSGQQRLTSEALVVLCLLSFLAWPLLALLQEFLVETLEPALKGTGGDLLLTVNICSFVVWASSFGVLVDLSGSFEVTLRLIAALCLISVPLMLFVSKTGRETGRLEAQSSAN